MNRKAILSLLTASLVSVASAFTQGDVHYWIGDPAGTNKCVVVFDWKGNAKAWGYQWNGACTNLLEVVNEIVHEDKRLASKIQKMTANYYDLYFFGYDANNSNPLWDVDAGTSSDPGALCGVEDKVNYSEWWVLYGPMNGSSFPSVEQMSSWTAANGLFPVNDDWFVFTIGAPETDANWNESPAVLTVPTAAESPYGYRVVAYRSDVVKADFKVPANVIGRPTTYMTGQWGGPVTPYNPAWKANELYSLESFDENEAYVTIEFDHDVVDDEANPFGIDFIVFGNSIGEGTTTTYYGETTGPDSMAYTGVGSAERALVSVSQDGNIWYTFDHGPYADDFAGTQGLLYDPAGDYKYPYAGNRWWGRPTDATKPVDPSITWSDLVGLTIGDVCKRYNGSAGGTGYDISTLPLPTNAEGKKWFRYVKVASMWDAEEEEYTAPDVDAVSDVRPAAGWELYVNGNFADWNTRWDTNVTGKSVVAGNGKSNYRNYLDGALAYVFGEELTEQNFRISGFVPGDEYHEVKMVSSAPFPVDCADVISVLQTTSLTNAWKASMPAISATMLDNGTYENTFRVKNNGSFLKLVIGE